MVDAVDWMSFQIHMLNIITSMMCGDGSVRGDYVLRDELISWMELVHLWKKASLPLSPLEDTVRRWPFWIRVLTRHQISWHFDLELRSLQKLWEIIFVVWTVQPLVFCLIYLFIYFLVFCFSNPNLLKQWGNFPIAKN